MADWQTLVARLREIHTEILRFAPFRDFGLVPNPGASPLAIETAEHRLGMHLPPSYRAFLGRFDGWPRFFDGASLLSTACLGNRLYDDFARAAFAAAETPFPDRSSATRGAKQGRVIPFAADLQATTLFAFNPAVRSPDGEYEVIAWINEVGVRRDSFPSFLELLVDLSEHDLTAQSARLDAQVAELDATMLAAATLRQTA